MPALPSLYLSLIKKRKMPGLSRNKAASLIEAAEVCLDYQGHKPGTELDVSGALYGHYLLHWKTPGDVVRDTYADMQEATGEGAVAVAIAIIVSITEYSVVRRAKKKTGFDYWLGQKQGSLETRLEISGVLDGTQAQIDRRLKKKMEQMIPSDNGGLPGYAVAIGFGQPQARVAKK